MNPKASKIHDCCTASVSSDFVIQSLIGSIANMTIASNDTANTVKVPNRQKTLMQQTKMKHNNTIEAIHGVNQEKSELVVKNPLPTRTNARSENHQLDAAILGRLDRRDVLFLGPKNLTSIPMRKTFSNVLLDSLYPKFKNSFGPCLKKFRQKWCWEAICQRNGGLL